MPATEPGPEARPASATSGAASAGSVLVTLCSPGFSTTAPDLVGGALIPDAVRQACAAWGQRWFEPREVVIRVAREVFVAAEGLVFDRDGQILRHSIRQHEPEMLERAQAAVHRAIAGASVVRHERPLVLGKKRGAANYGHWMIEMLPMLHLALSRLADPRIGVLVHDVSEPMLGQIMQQTLRRLGIEDRRVRVSDLEPVFVRELIMVEGMTEHGCYMSPLVRDCHDRLAHGIAGRGVERVFLARGAGLGRNFADEAHMARLASERGYAVVSPAGLGLEGQIALMRDARLVAGVMGAAMTNLIYARAGCGAAVFAPAAMPDTFFWFIANLCGHRYREIRCAQSGAGDWNRPLDLGFRSFRRVLDHEVAAVTGRMLGEEAKGSALDPLGPAAPDPDP